MKKMQGDDPPYLSVGTAVSAKYKGAFCEAKVSKVVRIVKCRVTYKMGLGTATVNDEQIKGALRVGQLVQAKHSEKKDFVEATITKIQDCSQYTVVFDDGDITTLRRSALCLKSGRHFNESETLDQLPLTHPEHFCNPVMGRRSRKRRQLKEDSSDGEAEEENEPDLELYSTDIGKVVSVEASDKKRNKDNWFPGLVVMPSAQPTVRINVKDEYLVRSFKDGRYYTVPKKEVLEFKREMGAKVESPTLTEAVEKAIKYLEHNELPVHWERNSLFNLQAQYSDSDENCSDSSDDEPTEEKDHFVAQLYKFMDDSGTPLNKTPTIASRDVDLYRLFRIVEKFGGFNRVTNQNKWKSVTARLKFVQNQSSFNQVKQVYKKCLLSYEGFYRTLGCTMLNPTRNGKKNRGRPLIRERDRMTPVQSPKPEKDKDDELSNVESKKSDEETKPPKKIEKKPEVEDKKPLVRKEPPVESSDNSSDATDQLELVAVASTSHQIGRPKRTDVKKEKKVKAATGDKVKALVDKFEEQSKKQEKEEDKNVQQTRSKSQGPRAVKEPESPEKRKPEPEAKIPPAKEAPIKPIPKVGAPKKAASDDDKEKKRGRKRINPIEEKEKAHSDSNESIINTANVLKSPVHIGDKLKVYYGPTHESKVTYEAKVIEVDKDNSTGQFMYLVHYTGWNTRYDEWIIESRIAENLSQTTKAKRLKQGTPSGSKASPKPPGKRRRGMSITGRSTVQDTPRSTTPSSVTSSSSRTKSPATPVSRGRSMRESSRRTRRTSAQTDISVQTDSESDENDRSESDVELPPRTRSSSKCEEVENKTYKRRYVKSKRKEDDDTEEEETTKKPSKKYKKVVNEPKSDSDDEVLVPPVKGCNFDLNQIRSELKGISKPVKVNEAGEKETVSSSDDSTNNTDKKETTSTDTDLEEKDNIKKEKQIEKSSSSEDIYEFKEPEPFEIVSRKINDDKLKKRIPRVFEEIEKSPTKKKSPKSPIKQEVKEPEVEKKRYKKTPTKKTPEEPPEETDVKPVEKEIKKEKSDDPFDKLVESPSFHAGKSTVLEKTPEKADTATKTELGNAEDAANIFDSTFNDDDNSDDKLELSDNDDRPSDLTFNRISPLFTTFGKPSPAHILDEACGSFDSNKNEDTKLKDSEDDEDSIKASIQRVIAQSALTDDESNDLLLDMKPLKTPSDLLSKSSHTVTLSRVEAEDSSSFQEEIVDKGAHFTKQISTAFQESSSCALDLYIDTLGLPKNIDDAKEHNKKAGPKIADSILQKLTKSKDTKVKSEEKSIVELAEIKPIACKSKPAETKVIKNESSVIVEPKSKVETKSVAKTLPAAKKPETEKKRKKFVSREFIEDSETDSDSDSEQRLVIARSDEDSQTSGSMDNTKRDAETDIDLPTDDSSNKPEERNFKIENDVVSAVETKPETETKTETCDDDPKEEEPDSHLHLMLLCKETIPGSPAPSSANEPPPKSQAIMEMPFACAPGSSNNNAKSLSSSMGGGSGQQEKPSVVPGALLVNALDSRDNTNTVMDNTPPTTPESSISNLSPRGEIGGLSPNNDNESCKSNEVEMDYSSNSQRRTAATKITNYSEEDSLMNCEAQTSTSKKQQEDSPSPCKKRRRSCKGDSDGPTKRLRKPNRSRHNSDSDDASEHAATHGGILSGLDARLARSPRPSKYNFFVELDPSLDSAARIAVLQQKLQDLRKTYADVKAELVTIERRRKKIRRREREAAKAAKQELACS